MGEKEYTAFYSHEDKAWRVHAPGRTGKELEELVKELERQRLEVEGSAGYKAENPDYVILDNSRYNPKNYGPNKYGPTQYKRKQKKR